MNFRFTRFCRLPCFFGLDTGQGAGLHWVITDLGHGALTQRQPPARY